MDGLEEDDPNLNLPPHEAKVLRYVAGFLPFPVKSLYETRNDATSTETVYLTPGDYQTMLMNKNKHILSSQILGMIELMVADYF